MSGVGNVKSRCLGYSRGRDTSGTTGRPGPGLVRV